MHHSHDWTVNCLSQCDQRYLETTVTIDDQDQGNRDDLGHEGRPNLMFRVRLHPQGNKESNKDFCFFQVFPITHVNKYKAKFFVHNNKGDEISTTIYAGTQQLNGYFEYVRRDLLLSHVAPDDEVHLTVKLTIFAEPVTRCGNYKLEDARDTTDDVGKDYEKEFNNPRFSDFKILCKGEDGSKTLNVHKVILTARSAFFNAMLSPHTHEFKNDEVTFDDIEFEVMTELIHFLYTGRTRKLDLYALELLALADRFQVPALKEASERYLKQNMKTESICTTFVMADLHNSKELKEAALNYIADNSMEVVKTEGWQRMIETQGRLITDIILRMSDNNRMEPSTKRFRKG